MVIDINSVNINSVVVNKINLDATGIDEIYQNLNVLYTTPEGTVPFDREFGINTDILDNPLPIAKGLLIAEYINKTRKYEPRAKVKKVDFEYREETIVPKVVIEIVTT